RVAHLAVAIAQEMGLSEEVIDAVRTAALLHDIGKLYIPGEIMSRPGKLSRPELDLIRTHARAGYEILQPIDFPWPVADIVLQHHERLDGSGYPQGLSGESVMLEARILAVADVVEAMLSHRPYRPARTIEEARRELEAGRGSLYDPEVTDACLRLLDRIPPGTLFADLS
ncbi:MAG: HD-GYP domain-containing protein, partial [Bacillota bacterium]